MITKIAFIGHPTRDIERAKHFYGEVLGLKKSANYDDKWIEFDTPEGKSIALDTFSPQLEPEAGAYLALETDDLEAEMARLKEHGVKVLKQAWTNHHPESGEEICKMAIILDSEGNTLMLHQIAPGRAGGG